VKVFWPGLTGYARGAAIESQLEARALYQEASEETDRPPAQEERFQIVLLLGMLERELGLTDGGTFETAGGLAHADTAPKEWVTLLKIAETTAWQDVDVSKKILNGNLLARGHIFRGRSARLIGHIEAL